MNNRESIQDILKGSYSQSVLTDKLEKLIWDNIYMTVGWTFAEVRYLTGKSIDIRNYDNSKLIPRIEEDFGKT